MQPVALWVCPVGEFAGVARHITDVARVGLPGYRLVVTAPEGPLLDRLYALGCPAVPLPVEGTPTHRTVRTLRETVRRLRPAVVHSHLAKADFLVAMATVGMPVRLVSTEHHVPEDPLTFHGSRAKSMSRRGAHHARIRRFDQLIAVSESTRRDMLRQWRPSAPVTVIRNGVDRLAPQQDPPTGLRLLSLSRLSPEKNVETTLEVFARLRNRHPDATLTVAGQGDERAALEQLAGRLGIEDATTFPGFVDAEEAMADHDVLVQPSRADNLSYTLLDAVNRGMGVVASDIGGNPEILPPGCLAGPDDVDALAVAVVEQGTQPEARPSLPTNIPDVAGMVRQIVGIYEQAHPTPDHVDTAGAA